eukprot:5195017-Amphidinium_carterae.5
MADLIHYVFQKEIASKSPSSPSLDHWARSEEGTAWIRVHNEPKDIDYAANDDCALPFDSRQIEYVTVERDHVNGEHATAIIPMVLKSNEPVSNMPWTGRTKYQLKRLDAAAPTPVLSNSESTASDRSVEDYPLMPVQDHVPEHRDKVQGGIQCSAMVTKQLTNKEIASDPLAQEATTKEYNKHKNHTWDETKVKEFDEVVKEAKAKGETFHVGRVFGIAGIKGHELPVGHPLRKYKGRYVFQGNNAKTRMAIGPSLENLELLPHQWQRASSLTLLACYPATQ